MTRVGVGRWRAALVLLVLAMGGWLVLARHRDVPDARDQARMQRAALLALFVWREHPRQVVFWSDTANVSPTLQLLRATGMAIEPVQPDTAALALPLPVRLESLRSLEQLFREEPDGWEAWFARFPASSGLVALTRPVGLPRQPDGVDRATVVVARTCGEHCHSAWRVTLVRRSGPEWRVQAIEPLALPRD